MPNPAQYPTQQRGTLCARVRQSFDGFDLHADLMLRPGRITAVFGPSGCGKTSLLRILTGLLPSPRSVVSFDGTHWQGADRKPLPPHQRPVGVVFQDSSLLPHLSVRQNLFFGAKRQERRGWFASSPQQGTSQNRAPQLAGQDMIARLCLGPLLGRATGDLSGGERQRVALGRALLVRPAVLFLDEPLSALDDAARRALLPCLRDLTTMIPGPIVLITHALDEVMALADDLIMMDGGRVVDSGAINNVLSNPALPLACREEAATLFSATLCDETDGVFTVALGDAFAGQVLRLPARRGHDKKTGDNLRLCAFARDVTVDPLNPRRLVRQTIFCDPQNLKYSPVLENSFPASQLRREGDRGIHATDPRNHDAVSCRGRVLSITPLPDHEACALVVVQVGTTPLLARVWRQDCRLQVGAEVSLEITRLSCL